MALNTQQITVLLTLVASTTEDELDCDGCYGRIAEFAEVELAGASIPQAIHSVKGHLANCPCCQDEFESLLTALSEL